MGSEMCIRDRRNRHPAFRSAAPASRISHGPRRGGGDCRGIDRPRHVPQPSGTGAGRTGRLGPRAAVSGLVVLGVLVDRPDVVHEPAGEDVLRGEHRGHHGVILVVVFVHPVAADQVQVGVVGGDCLLYTSDAADE